MAQFETQIVQIIDQHFVAQKRAKTHKFKHYLTANDSTFLYTPKNTNNKKPMMAKLPFLKFN